MENYREQLLSEDKIQIQQGLEALAGKLRELSGTEFEEAVQSVVGLFYIDPMDHPELLPVLEQAEDLLADLREPAIPVILGCLGESDLKTHFHLAAVLGKMGYAATAPLLQAYPQLDDTYSRIFVLYALGKIKAPNVLDALPLLFEALDDPDGEVRDTAARALGKVCEHLDPSQVSVATREAIFDKLLLCAQDSYAGVRSKAMRSLGKMARYGFADADRKAALRELLHKALGRDEASNWDVAYIVRAEAQKALRHL